ncbi:MAG: thioredoxin fold domain-containing protein, partial [candidate division Zixibacteria bacterium]|nr:thioredoxin fold domain-containing protein [candidate division Zixibacteria bacterium]
MKKLNKSNLFFLSLAFVVVMLLSFGCGEKEECDTATGPSIDFVKGYEEAMATAKEKNQPVLIDFYTDWCRWCKVMDTVTFIDPLTVELSKSVVFAKVNAEVDTVAAKSNSVRGYPSILLFDSDGKEIDRIVGYLPGPEFVEAVNNYLNGIGTIDYYKAMADSAPTPEVEYYLAQKYDERGMYEEAEGLYQNVVKNNKDNDSDYTSGSMLALASISL